jgi:HSP20 family protein
MNLKNPFVIFKKHALKSCQARGTMFVSLTPKNVWYLNSNLRRHKMYKGMFYHPWRDVRNLKRDIHQVVNDFLGNEPEWEGGYWQPAVDMVEIEDAYIIAAELPGVEKDEIKINVNENNLQLNGERKPFRDAKDRLRSECYYGPFKRSINIPGEVNREKIIAKYENGILEVTLPKKEKSKAKEIKIEVK